MQHGIFDNISSDEYHSSEGISNSGISLLMDCPRRYWYEYLSGKSQKKETKSLLLGKALHCLILEPEKFNHQFAILPPDKKTTKSGKSIHSSFEASNIGKDFLKESEYNELLEIAVSVKNNFVFNKIFTPGKIEHSLFWQYEGVQLRSRPDYFNDLLVMDLKTTESCNPNDFWWSIMKYGYHRQAAMALDGLTALTGKNYTISIIFAVEKKPPYISQAFLLGNDLIELGRKEYKESALRYKKYIETGNWPTYSDAIMQLTKEKPNARN